MHARVCLWGFLLFTFIYFFFFHLYILYNFCISYYFVWGVCITSLSIDLDRYRIFFQLNSNLMCGNLKCCVCYTAEVEKVTTQLMSKDLLQDLEVRITIRWRKSLTFWCCFYGTFVCFFLSNLLLLFFALKILFYFNWDNFKS